MPGPPPSTFNLPTFTVAAIGAATGLISIAWNVVPRISSAAKIRVKVHYVFHVPKGPIFEVHAYNKRKEPVAIRNWGVSYHRPGEAVGTVMLAGSTLADHYDNVPDTISGCASATWAVLARELVAFDMNEKHPLVIRGVVELATGRERTSRPLRLPAGLLHQTLPADDDDHAAPPSRRLPRLRLSSLRFRAKKPT